jgi:hypothetical protein
MSHKKKAHIKEELHKGHHEGTTGPAMAVKHKVASHHHKKHKGK